MEYVDTAVLLRVPRQLVVVPQLLDPQVRRHDLVTQVLNKEWRIIPAYTNNKINSKKNHAT